MASNSASAAGGGCCRSGCRSGCRSRSRCAHGARGAAASAVAVARGSSASCAAERPSKTSRSTTPNEKTSEALKKRPPERRCNGSVYGGVPTTPAEATWSPSSSQTRPQSPSFATVPEPSSVLKRNMPELLMSRWTSRKSWSAQRPRAAPATAQYPSDGSGGVERKSSPRIPCSGHGCTSARHGMQKARSGTKWSWHKQLRI
mmetsp:Transcript_120606/g.336534  ORF Transcript_120606/g.336534 Transcript_120606/m.336534 type:complete len:202 (-) Transcript_120606:609-1214(-)